jgi:hypothetical protein
MNGSSSLSRLTNAFGQPADKDMLEMLGIGADELDFDAPSPDPVVCATRITQCSAIAFALPANANLRYAG